MAVTPPTDPELDSLALTYWALLGIDVSVLPAEDPAAVVDLARCLASARGVLRAEADISNYRVDIQADLPVLYPAPFSRWTGEDA